MPSKSILTINQFLVIEFYRIDIGEPFRVYDWYLKFMYSDYMWNQQENWIRLEMCGEENCSKIQTLNKFA